MTIRSPSAPRFSAAAVALAAALCACSGTSIGEKLEIGAPCEGRDDLCQSGLCYSVDSGTSLCTAACAVGMECPAGYFCEKTPDRDSLCLPVGIGGRCAKDGECPAGHHCDIDSNRCYIRVQRDLCGPCTSSKQCPEGGVCHAAATGERFCTRACDAAACPAGHSCETIDGAAAKQCIPASNTCSAGKPLCSPCRGDSECGAFTDLCVRNLQSQEQFCAKSCQPGASDACPPGFNCLGLGGAGRGPFQCVPNSGSCADYCDSDDPEAVRRMCGLGRSCDVAARHCQSASDGRLCASCEDDDGCPSTDNSTRCVVNNCTDCPYKGEKFCATTCSGPGAACPPGFTCVGLGSGGTTGPWHCVPHTGTCRAGAGQLGDDCGGRGGLACLSGICLGFGRQSVCSTPCTGDGDCQDARYRCCAVAQESGRETFDCRQSPGAAGGVCAPRGGALGADCSPGQPPCSDGACLDLGTAHLCTKSCGDASPCPDGFLCQKARLPKADGTFDDVSVCFPDGGGGLGADCSFGPAACSSRLCLKKPSGNECTVACDAAAPCASGYDCRAAQTVDNQSVQVCIPPGL